MLRNEYSGTETAMVCYGNRVNGFLAIPENAVEICGAIILGHERYGLVQHTLDLTAKFALHGFIALAPDMYSRWEGDKDALARGDISVPLSDEDIISYMGDSLDFLQADPRVAPERVAAMGVCQSGDYPLVLNSVRKELAANIVVYGGAQQRSWELSETRRIPYESIIERISAPVLGIWGEGDWVVSVEDMRRLRNTLESNRKSYEFKLFRDMPHGWMNSTMAGRYRPKESEEAWMLILNFLRRVFAGDFPADRVIWRFDSDISPAYDFSQNVRLA